MADVKRVPPQKSTSAIFQCKSLSRTPKPLQPKLKRKLREQLEKLDNTMIRRHRIPYHEALCMELRENNYEHAAYYIRSLIRYNDEIRNAHGPDTFFWLLPTLAETREHLDVLRAGLEEAERARRSYDLRAESRSFLRMGIHFMQQSAAWWWIAEQLLLESINVATDFRSDGYRQETLSRYVFGRFLVLQLRCVNEGLDQLKVCREYSTSKQWTASDELGVKQETIFVECCTLMTDIMIEQAREERKTDPYKAVRTATIALKRATETEIDAVMAKGYLELGICKYEANSPMDAIAAYEKSLALYRKTRDVPGACETLMELALAYTRCEKPDALATCERHLLDMIRLAAGDESAAHWSAKAHECFGLFCLTYHRDDDGEEHTRRAFDMFCENGETGEIVKARCLAGVAAGQHRFESYAKIVKKGGRHDARMTNVMKVVDWKDARDPFPAEADATRRSMTEIREIASTLSLRTLIEEMLPDCVEN